MTERKALAISPLCVAEHLKDDDIIAATCKDNLIGRSLFRLLNAIPRISGVFRDEGIDLRQGLGSKVRSPIARHDLTFQN
jgi:hypothetical protein